MVYKLGLEAEELAEYMSDLSEKAYYAGWMQGVEFELWDAMENGPREYGLLAITHEHISELRRLSESARGWIVFDDTYGQVLLPLKNWVRRFETWKRGQNP